MRKLAIPLAILIIFSLALPAWAGGPFNIRPPVAASRHRPPGGDGDRLAAAPYDQKR